MTVTTENGNVLPLGTEETNVTPKEIPELILTDEVREQLAQEMYDVLTYYDHNADRDVCSDIIDQWFETKGKVMAPFATLDEWVANKFMLVFKNDYERTVDIDEVSKFCDFMYRFRNKVLEHQIYFGVYTYYEACDIRDSLEDIINLLNKNKVTEVNGIYRKENIPELDARRVKFADELYNKGHRNYTIESSKKRDAIARMRELISNIVSDEDFNGLLTQNYAEKMNYIAEGLCKINATEGQKIMKPLLKFCRFFGMDKQNEIIGENHGRPVYSEDSWNKRWAALGDAINPLHYDRFTILSFNPIDYLRMSMGANWRSCHTIDKNNIDHRGGDGYSGMHANGTMSYMLDPSSAVFYTVDARYEGEDFEMQDKQIRQMFHFGTIDSPAFIAGRIYPQSNDCGSNSLYKQVREVVQLILSRAWQIDNLWSTERTKHDSTLINNVGDNHYPDFFHFDDVCRTSRNKTANKFNLIQIGADKCTCITCGGSNNYNREELSCCEPTSGCKCAGCGNFFDEDDLYYIDDNYYCSDCSFWCDYHEEREVGEPYGWYRNNNYSFCEYAYEWEDIYYCEQCNECFDLNDDGTIETSDGEHFCCNDCAERNGYHYCESTNEWEHEDNMFRCEECGEWFLTEECREHEDECFCNECYENVVGNEVEEVA